MILQFERFVRERCVRLTSHLTRPPIHPLNELTFPVNSHLHYTEHGSEINGIKRDNPLLANIAPSAEVVADFQLGWPDGFTPKGKTTPMPFQDKRFIMEYHAQNPKIKRLAIAMGVAKRPTNLCVTNYSCMDMPVRYMPSPMNDYFHMSNYWEASFYRLNQIASADQRHHFVVLHSPDVLPPLSLLNLCVKKGIDRNLFNRIKTEDRFIVSQLWQWAEDVVDNVFSPLRAIEDRVHFIVVKANSWMCFNLATIRSWSKKEDKGSLTTDQLQKRILTMFISFNEKAIGPATVNTVFNDDSGMENDIDEESLTAKLEEELEDTDGMPTQLKTDSATLGVNGDNVINNQDKLLASIKAKAGVVGKTVKVQEVFNSQLTEDNDINEALDTLEEINDEVEEREYKSKIGYQAYTPPPATIEQGVLKRVDDLASKGRLSSAEVRRYRTLSEKYKTINDPYGSGKTIKDQLLITGKELEIPLQNKLSESINGVLDESMLSSSLDIFDRRYIQDTLPKDVLNSVMFIQKAGFIVSDYNISKHENLNDAYEVHSIKVIPVEGKPSTLKIQVPIVNQDGVFKAGGVKNFMRKQRVDLPILKVSSDEVSLTSYYSKMFVTRSERAVFNYEKWIGNQIRANAIGDNPTILDIKYSNVFDRDADKPLVYSAISKSVSGFKFGKYTFSFDHKNRAKVFGSDVSEQFDKTETRQTLIGKGPNTLLVMDNDGLVYECSVVKAGDNKPLGYIEEVLGLELDKKPVESVELDVMGKKIPLGIVLSYHIGLGNLLATLKCKSRRIPKGSRSFMEPYEFGIRFNDETLILDRREYLSTIILNSFNQYHAKIKEYSIYDFDKPDVYGALFDQVGLGARYTRELSLIRDLWVDHITADLLVEMNEPTDMIALYISAATKLLKASHPEPMSRAYQRDRGYERISGFIYGELIRSIRSYNGKPSKAFASLDLNPRAVWLSILQDQTVGPIEESNPIHYLKEKEVVVFRGSGGRSTRAMTASSRGFDKTSIGVVSEATVDNGDTGTVTYLTADPNYKSVRGTVRVGTDLSKTVTKVLNTSTLLCPGAEYDDAKRRNFISIQNSRSTNCEHATPMPMRTGYEKVLGYRTNDMFAKVARQDGVVEKVSDKVIIVRYKDGSTEPFELGTRFGTWSGKTIPHELTTKLKTGDKFKAGAPLCYNEKFFKVDTLDNSLIYKPGVLGYVAFMSTMDTYEDSSLVSSEFAKKLVTAQTEVRNIDVEFDREVRDLIKIGDRVDFDTILCTLYNPTAGNTDIFNEQALQTLKDVSASNPRAKNVGVVSDIRVLYCGETESMSASLADITSTSDGRLYKLNRELKRPGMDGSVEAGYRCNGKPIEPNSAVIQIFINIDAEVRPGNKIVVGHQMKSVIGRVDEKPIVTSEGRSVDVLFDYQSISNRIVNSPEFIGSTNTLLVRLGEMMAETYFGNEGN